MSVLPILGYLGALSAGILLGLMGGGGSIITIPILIYFFHISPITAMAYSLFVVGTSATVGTLNNLKKSFATYRIAILFAIPTIISAYIVRKYIVPIIPLEIIKVKSIIITKDSSIMVLFAIVMLLSAIAMIKKRKLSPKTIIYDTYNYGFIILIGIVIGLLTGIIGIGGGFLIIPTLVLFVKLPMQRAVATSLGIIAIKSLIGFLGDMTTININWNFLLQFTFVSTIGVFLGTYFSSFMNGEKLKKYFGWMILLVSLAIMYKEIYFLYGSNA